MEGLSTYKWFGFPESLSIGIVSVAGIVFLAAYVPGLDLGKFKVPNINWLASKKAKWISFLFLILSLLGFLPVWSTQVAKEPRYSLQFDNISLVAAVKDLDKRALDVEILLDDDLLSGKVNTKQFGVTLHDATFSEILDVFCNKAMLDRKITWRKSGRIIFIETLKLTQPEGERGFGGTGGYEPVFDKDNIFPRAFAGAKPGVPLSLIRAAFPSPPGLISHVHGRPFYEFPVATGPFKRILFYFDDKIGDPLITRVSFIFRDKHAADHVKNSALAALNTRYAETTATGAISWSGGYYGGYNTKLDDVSFTID